MKKKKKKDDVKHAKRKRPATQFKPKNTKNPQKKKFLLKTDFMFLFIASFL